MKHTALTLVALIAFLGTVAAVAPKPWFVTDEYVYETTARRFVIADCSDLQCFRVLVPWIIGRMPGPQGFRWKAYAVVSTAGAALALGRFCLVIGQSPAAARMAIWLVALGFGPLLTIYNPYTADPLMYLAGPLIAAELFIGRRGKAACLAIIGVFAKEVAAAPLWIFCAWSLLKRQWLTAARTFAAAVAATAVWVWLQLWLMVRFNYSYGGSKSTDLLHGGDFIVWYGHMGPRSAAVAIFTAFGALFVLMPIGFARASRDLRLLAIAALPAALILSYVQQPDRALWNFHYVLIPFAVIALESLPAVWRWTFIACYAAANLRIGAQLTFIPAARFALLASILIALAAVAATLRRPRVRTATPPAAVTAAPWSIRSGAWIFVAEAVAVALAVLLILDIRAHAAVEQENGPNSRGYRGTVRLTASGGARIAVVGGSAAYSPRVDWPHSWPYYLERDLAQAWRGGFPGYVTEVINLAAVGDGSGSYVRTLEDYAYLKLDAICIYDGYSGMGATTGGVRHRSAVFAKTGYLPILGDVLARRAPWEAADRTLVDPQLRDDAVGDVSCAAGSRAQCDAIVDTVEWITARGMNAAVVTPPYISARHQAQQASLAALIGERFRNNRRVQYTNIGRSIDVHDPAMSSDGVHPTARGNDAIADNLVDAMYGVIKPR
jgi:hypothetical protein